MGVSSILRGACAGVLLAACGDTSGALGGVGPTSGVVQVRGVVFASQVGTSAPTGLVVGATVSSSLDAVTTTTGTDGSFTLTTLTTSPNPGCENFTLTIAATGSPTYSVAATWGGATTPFTIVLSPPSPATFKNANCP